MKLLPASAIVPPVAWTLPLRMPVVELFPEPASVPPPLRFTCVLASEPVTLSVPALTFVAPE